MSGAGRSWDPSGLKSVAVAPNGDFLVMTLQRALGSDFLAIDRITRNGFVMPRKLISNLAVGFYMTVGLHILPLPAGGYAIAGLVENAGVWTPQRRPFVAYVNDAGTLVWSKILTEYPLSTGVCEARHIQVGPSNSLTVVATDGVNEYIQRFAADGSPIGFRGSIGAFASNAKYIASGDRVVRYAFQDAPRGVRVQSFTPDAIAYPASVVPLGSGTPGFVQAVSQSNNIYISTLTEGVGFANTNLSRIDSEGNLRWTINGPAVDSLSSALRATLTGCQWAVRTYSGFYAFTTVNSIGETMWTYVPREIRDFDAVGPIGNWTDSVHGYTTSGGFRFLATDTSSDLIYPGRDGDAITLSLSTPRAFPASYPYGLTQPWSARCFRQATVAQPDSFRARKDVTLLKTETTGTLVNDPFKEGALTSVQRAPSQGTLRMFSRGDFEYVPKPGYVGLDSFDYRVVKDGMTSVAMATLRVLGPGEVYSWLNTNPKFATVGLTTNLRVEIEPSTTTTRVYLTSDNPTAVVPAYVDVPAAGTVATVPISVSGTAGSGTANITARTSVFSVSTSVSIVPAQVRAIRTPGTVLRPGGYVDCTVEIDRPAPTALGVGLLSDASNLLTLPSTATIPTGATSATFRVTLRTAPAAATTVYLYGRRSGTGGSGVLSIAP